MMSSILYYINYIPNMVCCEQLFFLHLQFVKDYFRHLTKKSNIFIKKKKVAIFVFHGIEYTRIITLKIARATLNRTFAPS